jgi:polar amino acid transport system substrate-binding protein
MPRIFSLISILCLGIVVIAGCSPTPAPTATLRPTAVPTQAASSEVLVVTGEFPPFTSESIEGGGIHTEIVRAVFAAMDVPVRVEFYPWERAERLVEVGDAWAAFPYVPTEERRTRFDFTDNLSYARTMWFYYGDAERDIAYDSLSDLSAYRIGVSSGYWYIPSLQAAGLTLDEGSDDLDNLRKLQAGRVDLFPIHEYIAGWLINRNFSENAARFRFLAAPFDVSPDALMVSRAYPDSAALTERFNRALAQIIDDGTYAAVFEQYGITPFIPEAGQSEG